MLCKVKAKLCKVKTELCKGEEKRKRKNCSGTEQKEKKKMKKAKCTNSEQKNPGGKKERGNLSTWEKGGKTELYTKLCTLSTKKWITCVVYIVKKKNGRFVYKS